MVSRYGGRKPESTVHCFMPHCAHPPPQHHQQHPPPPLSQFRIISTNTGRTDVSFHVAGPTYPSQQGGGAGPPGGPQLRGLHHPHHGGNPALPPPHQQQPPPPPQSQHSGGPPGPGPAPTSTPPGPADMNKQGPPHMQGQQQIQQGQQMQINYAVPSQSRPAGAQGYFTGPRGPAPPRIPTHRAQVVNMPTNNVGQQMFSPHVQMQQIPQIYANQVVPAQLHPSQSMVFSQGQLPVFPGQPRHQNHVGTGFYAQGSHHQILMTTQQPLYQNYPTHATQAGAQYYYAPNPVNLARPGATPGPGVAGTGLAGATAQQVVPGVPPPPSIAQAGQIPLGMVATSGLNMAAMPGDGGTAANPVVGSNMGKQHRRRFAIDIVDPKTGKNILFDDNNGTTPPRSGDSSSRETPQLNTGPGGMDVAAEFAARVAKVASEKSSPPPPQAPYLESPLSLDSVAQIVTVNGPDANTNNLSPQDDISQPETAFSKQKMVALEEPNAWKQSQSSNVGNISSASNKHQSETNLVKTNKIESDNNSNVVNQVININVRDSIAVAEIAQQSPVIVNIEPFQVEVPLQPPTPVVSALTNNPAVDVIHHKAGPKEPFPALNPVTTSVGSTSLNVQSPRKKRVDGAPTSSDKMGGPLTAAFVPSTPIQTVPVSVAPIVDARQREPSLPPANPDVPMVEAKPQKKSPSPTVLSEDAPVSTVLPQKEKKEEKPKEREKIAQIKELDKSLQNRGKDKTSHVKEQSRGREKSSQDKEKASQPQFRDREKSSPSHGRNKDTPPPTPTETVQGEILPPMPLVVKPLLSAPIVDHKQANGETTPEGSEGKATQRSKQKRVAKMKDYNRKGVGKEGSDMDAFVGSATEETPPPSAVAAPTPAPTPVATPVPVAAVVTPAQVLPPVPRVPEAESPVTVEVPARPIVIDSPEPKEGEEQQPDVYAEEEKLVTALNEENTKVSAAALKEDILPVIENIPVVPALFNDKLPYKNDQWSPVNPDGKKKYERDFLMELQNDPQSKKKPENLPDLEVVLNNSSNRQPRAMDSRPLMNQNRTHESLTPNFALRGSGGPRYQGPIPKRNSQQGKPKSNKPNVIHVSLSLREDIKLHETENAWKPGRAKGNSASEVEAKTEELYKKVRSVLNKLTPQKFHTLVNQVQSLPIDNSERLLGVINLVFEKAVDEPSFSVAYAQMCKVLSNMQVPADRKTKEDSEFVEFRKLLLNRCQHEFEKSTEAELNRDEKLKEIEATIDPEKKKELQALYDEEERKIRMKSVGNIRFIGELFKLQMLTVSIMIRCIKHLLSEGDEESLECLCKLLTTIGKDLESKQSLDQYFDKMRDLSMKRGKISSRVRFMLQDVLELRNCKWKPRRDDSAPKTIDQIQKEAEKETSDMLIALNSAQQTPRRQDDRGGGGGGGNTMDRRKNRGGPGGGNMNEDGWNTVAPGNRSNSRIAVDTNKFKLNKDSDLAINLGSKNLFSSWGKGAAIKTEPEKKGPQYSSTNYYSALINANEMPEERRQPPSIISSSRAGPGKSTPTPSIEKERMVASFKPAMEDSRPTQTSGHPSRSSSRDNSVRRSEESFRPSASISVDNDSVMNARPTILPPVIPPSITTEQLERKTHLLLDEFFQNANLQEAEQTVVETFSDSNFNAFVLECINYVMERTSHARLSLGKLLCHLLCNGIVKKKYYIEGLKSFLSFADDYAIDVPKVWLYVAEIIVPLMSTEVITFTDFQKIVEDIKPLNFIISLFPLLIKDKGPNWIKDRWDAANLKWTDFMEPDQVSTFVKDYHFEFTLGAPTYPQSYQVASTALSMTDVENKILEFLLSSNPFDQITSWISANVGDKVAEPQFIRALSTAVVRSAIHKQNTSWKLKVELLRKEENLLTKYMDNKENLELQCLFAIQALTNELEHPQGFLCLIFQTLWEDGIIPTESFLAWSICNDGHEVTGKAVALKSLTSFFTALKETENDSSCEDS